MPDLPQQPGPSMRLAVFSSAKGICVFCGHRIDGTRELWEPRCVNSSTEQPGLSDYRPAHLVCPTSTIEIPSESKAKRRMPFGRGSPLKRKINGQVVPA